MQTHPLKLARTNMEGNVLEGAALQSVSCSERSEEQARVVITFAERSEAQSATRLSEAKATLLFRDRIPVVGNYRQGQMCKR